MHQPQMLLRLMANHNTYDDCSLSREALRLQEVREVSRLVRVDEDKVEWLVRR